MKFGERRKILCKGKTMSKALWQEGAWAIPGPPKPGAGAPASRAPDGEGMGGNVIKPVETRSCVL